MEKKMTAGKSIILMLVLCVATLMSLFVLSVRAPLTWRIETVDSTGNVGYITSLALDSGDKPHISYMAPMGDLKNDLKYAWWNGSAWNIETVDSGGRVESQTSIALDSNDYSHISYFDQAAGDLKYATTAPVAPAYLAVRGTDDNIYYRSWAGSWTGWSKLPGKTSDSPAAAVLGNDLHIVVRGMTGGIYHGRLDLTTTVWSGWSKISGDTPSAPELAA